MFRFRLARLLDYRRRCEEQLEHAFRQKQEQLEQEVACLESLRHEARQVETQFSSSEGATLLGDDVYRWRHYYRLLEERIVHQQGVVGSATEALEASRQNLLEARRAKKTLEKLEARAHERYVQEQTHYDQRLIDESAMMRSRYGH